jgi:hypothetical protein
MYRRAPHVDWMNQRGGNAKIVVLPGEGHGFDAPYKRRRNVFGPHYAKCDVLVDETGVVELNSGMKAPGEDAASMMAKCVSTIYHSGFWKDRFIAVPHRIFQEESVVDASCCSVAIP